MSACARARLAIVVAACAAFAQTATAQVRRDATVDWLASANSEGEVYLRALQLVGTSAIYPWSLRAFSPADLHRLAPVDSGHPWSLSLSVPDRGARWRIIAPDAGVVFNSRFPFGANDGPVWAGRGLTTAITLGVQASYGPFDILIAPEFFRAENADFPLAPNGLVGPLAFANSQLPFNIDLPQRFGSTPYQRLDPGQSSVRISAAGLTAGVSTANEFWGPAVTNPFLLGNNAAGFPHLFFGSGRPLGFGGLALHVRAIAGRLEQSDYSTTPMVGRGHYLSGLVGVLTIRQIPGLELGGGRLFHNYYDDSTVSLSEIIRPLLQGFLAVQRARALGTVSGDEPNNNQIASAFARWVFPRSGLEFYGEFGREDASFDLRDLGEEPDHDSSYLLGFQKAWNRSTRHLILVRAEVFNDRISHLEAVRPQAPAYIHSHVTQGHTNRGQILGAPDGFGGGGSLLSLDSYTPDGRTSLQWTRSLRAPVYPAARQAVDVIHALSLERLSFHRRVDFVRGITFAYELNRDFGGDAVNIRANAGLRAHW